MYKRLLPESAIYKFIIIVIIIKLHKLIININLSLLTNISNDN